MDSRTRYKSICLIPKSLLCGLCRSDSFKKKRVLSRGRFEVLLVGGALRRAPLGLSVAPRVESAAIAETNFRTLPGTAYNGLLFLVGIWG